MAGVTLSAFQRLQKKSAIVHLMKYSYSSSGLPIASATMEPTTKLELAWRGRHIRDDELWSAAEVKAHKTITCLEDYLVQQIAITPDTAPGSMQRLGYRRTEKQWSRS